MLGINLNKFYIYASILGPLRTFIIIFTVDFTLFSYNNVIYRFYRFRIAESFVSDIEEKTEFLICTLCFPLT